MPYAPATDADIRSMLDTIGIADVDSLFADIPTDLRFRKPLDIPLGVGELELVREAGQLARRNIDVDRELSFLGYGAYDHLVPAICGAITSRSEFATAYTPYQPEISQGTLQAIFEFQTAICELAGLPVSNASLYDGATALVEAISMACAGVTSPSILVPGSLNGFVRRVVDSYARVLGMNITTVAVDPVTGILPLDRVSDALVGGDFHAVVLQQPNALGQLEAAPDVCALAAEHGAVPIAMVDPHSLGVLESPGAYGAQIVVGDGQGLGNQLSFGGPSFGFMAASETFIRRMPGRIVGETVDADGDRAYVLTLQTREQHIRREKATSNICTNQSLNALAGIVYLSWLGPAGLSQLAQLIFERSRAAADRLAAVDGIELAFPGAPFKDVAVRVSRPARDVIAAAKRHGVHPGFAAVREHPDLGEDLLLVGVTECRTNDDLDHLASVLEEVLA